jgi:endogenous inhibitor of DNA gyrase (YacG/DUF329 family)
MSEQSQTGTYETYCPQCEKRVTINGEVIEANDGTTGAMGPCPDCGNTITAMLARPIRS